MPGLPGLQRDRGSERRAVGALGARPAAPAGAVEPAPEFIRGGAPARDHAPGAQ